jgi:hypothetical protein
MVVGLPTADYQAKVMRPGFSARGTILPLVAAL